MGRPVWPVSEDKVDDWFGKESQDWGYLLKPVWICKEFSFKWIELDLESANKTVEKSGRQSVGQLWLNVKSNRRKKWHLDGALRFKF